MPRHLLDFETVFPHRQSTLDDIRVHESISADVNKLFYCVGAFDLVVSLPGFLRFLYQAGLFPSVVNMNSDFGEMPQGHLSPKIAHDIFYAAATDSVEDLPLPDFTMAIVFTAYVFTGQDNTDPAMILEALLSDRLREYIEAHTRYDPFPEDYYFSAQCMNVHRVFWYHREVLEELYEKFASESLDDGEAADDKPEGLTVNDFSRLCTAVGVCPQILNQAACKKMYRKCLTHLDSPMTFREMLQAIVRLGAQIFPEHQNYRLLTLEAKTERFIVSVLESEHITMELNYSVDENDPPVPVVHDVSPSVWSTQSGGTVRIEGENFGMLGKGVWVYMSAYDHLVHLPQSRVDAAGLIEFDIPSFHGSHFRSFSLQSAFTTQSTLDVAETTQKEMYLATAKFWSPISITIVNSPDDLPLLGEMAYSELQHTFTQVSIDSTVVVLLRAAFVKGCQRSSPYNNENLFEAGWKWLREEYGLSEGPYNAEALGLLPPPSTDRKLSLSSGTPTLSGGTEDLLFAKHSTIAEGDTTAVPSMTFHSFVDALVTSFFSNGVPIPEVGSTAKRIFTDNASSSMSQSFGGPNPRRVSVRSSLTSFRDSSSARRASEDPFGGPFAFPNDVQSEVGNDMMMPVPPEYPEIVVKVEKLNQENQVNKKILLQTITREQAGGQKAKDTIAGLRAKLAEAESVAERWSDAVQQVAMAVDEVKSISDHFYDRAKQTEINKEACYAQELVDKVCTTVSGLLERGIKGVPNEGLLKELGSASGKDFRLRVETMKKQSSMEIQKIKKDLEAQRKAEVERYQSELRLLRSETVTIIADAKKRISAVEYERAQLEESNRRLTGEIEEKTAENERLQRDLQVTHDGSQNQLREKDRQIAKLKGQLQEERRKAATTARAYASAAEAAEDNAGRRRSSTSVSSRRGSSMDHDIGVLRRKLTARDDEIDQLRQALEHHNIRDVNIDRLRHGQRGAPDGLVISASAPYPSITAATTPASNGASALNSAVPSAMVSPRSVRSNNSTFGGATFTNQPGSPQASVGNYVLQTDELPDISSTGRLLVDSVVKDLKATSSSPTVTKVIESAATRVEAAQRLVTISRQSNANIVRAAKASVVKLRNEFQALRAVCENYFKHFPAQFEAANFMVNYRAESSALFLRIVGTRIRLKFWRFKTKHLATAANAPELALDVAAEIEQYYIELLQLLDQRRGSQQSELDRILLTLAGKRRNKNLPALPSVPEKFLLRQRDRGDGRPGIQTSFDELVMSVMSPRGSPRHAVLGSRKGQVAADPEIEKAARHQDRLWKGGTGSQKPGEGISGDVQQPTERDIRVEQRAEKRRQRDRMLKEAIEQYNLNKALAAAPRPVQTKVSLTEALRMIDLLSNVPMFAARRSVDKALAVEGHQLAASMEDNRDKEPLLSLPAPPQPVAASRPLGSLTDGITVRHYESPRSMLAATLRSGSSAPSAYVSDDGGGSQGAWFVRDAVAKHQYLVPESQAGRQLDHHVFPVLHERVRAARAPRPPSNESRKQSILEQHMEIMVADDAEYHRGEGAAKTARVAPRRSQHESTPAATSVPPKSASARSNDGPLAAMMNEIAGRGAPTASSVPDILRPRTVDNAAAAAVLSTSRKRESRRGMGSTLGTAVQFPKGTTGDSKQKPPLRLDTLTLDRVRNKYHPK